MTYTTRPLENLSLKVTNDRRCLAVTLLLPLLFILLHLIVCSDFKSSSKKQSLGVAAVILLNALRLLWSTCILIITP
uniref:G_PROTEIN_RECEP_F1_2 domain-containing protein n=1 Tax=Heterorhabditis bacteriophora TaxID=37862 RepID=A0A1I7WFL7_HETBA